VYFDDGVQQESFSMGNQDLMALESKRVGRIEDDNKIELNKQIIT
jgi:hypothetical protein